MCYMSKPEGYIDIALTTARILFAVGWMTPEEARESCEEGCAEATQGGRKGSKAKSMKKGKPKSIELNSIDFSGAASSRSSQNHLNRACEPLLLEQHSPVGVLLLLHVLHGLAFLRLGLRLRPSEEHRENIGANADKLS